MFGYQLRGWSRTAKQIEGVEVFTGPDEFDAFLAGTDILVNLLPLTAETQGILNYETFTKLRRGGIDGEGPVVINAARGGHQRDADIVRALGDGTLKAASLDVFEVEPLPQESPLWAMDNVYITPHIAGASNERTGVAYLLEGDQGPRGGTAAAQRRGCRTGLLASRGVAPPSSGHPRVSGDLCLLDRKETEVPAFAGMTSWQAGQSGETP